MMNLTLKWQRQCHLSSDVTLNKGIKFALKSVVYF